MNDTEKQLLIDIHKKVHETAESVAVLQSTAKLNRREIRELENDVLEVQVKINRVEGAMWVLAVIFAGVGLVVKVWF